jgi:hypothetical protein
MYYNEKLYLMLNKYLDEDLKKYKFSFFFFLFYFVLYFIFVFVDTILINFIDIKVFSIRIELFLYLILSLKYFLIFFIVLTINKNLKINEYNQILLTFILMFAGILFGVFLCFADSDNLIALAKPCQELSDIVHEANKKDSLSLTNFSQSQKNYNRVHLEGFEVTDFDMYALGLNWCFNKFVTEPFIKPIVNSFVYQGLIVFSNLLKPFWFKTVSNKSLKVFKSFWNSDRVSVKFFYKDITLYMIKKNDLKKNKLNNYYIVNVLKKYFFK